MSQSEPMDRSLLHRYTNPTGQPPSLVEPDPVDDLGCFGWLRGTKDRCPMLELRKRTGAILAIGYSWIDRIEFEPSTGILISMSGPKIHIRGYNLNGEVRPSVRLFEGLARHKVPWMRESDPLLSASGSAGFVTLIEW